MPASGVTSVDKALDILLCFSSGEQELGVSQISRRLGLRASTVHRLLGRLVHKGFVRQNPHTQKYRPGYQIVQLAALVLANNDLRSACLPYLVRLRDLTGETARLHELVGGQRVCVEQVESQHQIRATGGIAKAYPLYSGAASKALLAFRPVEEIERVLATMPGQSLAPGSIVDPDRLRVELAHIREHGYAVSLEENAQGAASIAAPIRTFHGAVLAALTLTGPSNRWTPERMLSFAPQLVQMAREISEQFGSANAVQRRAPTVSDHAPVPAGLRADPWPVAADP